MRKAMEGFDKPKSRDLSLPVDNEAKHSKESDKGNKDGGMENRTLNDVTSKCNDSQQQSKPPNDTSVVSDIVTEEHNLERSEQIFKEQPSKDVRNDHNLPQNKIVSYTHPQESSQTESSPQDSVKDLNERECNISSSLDDSHVESNDKSQSHCSLKTSTSLSLSQDSTKDSSLDSVSLPLDSTEKQPEESEPCAMQNNRDLVLDQQTCPQLPPPSSSVSKTHPKSPLPLDVNASSQPQKDKDLNLPVPDVGSEATCPESITSPSTAAVSTSDKRHSMPLETSVSLSPNHSNLPENQSQPSPTNKNDLVSTSKKGAEVSFKSISKPSNASVPTSSSSNEQDQVRILTQYVFINRPHKKKSVKKKFGVVCKQGFRHYQRAKINFPSLFGKVKKGKEKNKTRNSASRRERTPSKGLASDSESDDSDKAKSVEGKRKHEPKSKKKDLSKKAACKNSKKAERSGRNQPKAKSSKRRVLCDGEISGVKDALRLPGATIQSVSSEFGVAKTIVRKLWQEVTSENKAAARKKAKKKAEKNESPIIIKEETPDDPVLCDVNGSMVQIDANNKQEVTENGDDTEPTPIFWGKFRRELTLDQKVQVIHELQKDGSKVTHVARKYGISSSSVSRLNKHKQSILYKAESGDVCRQMKRTRNCKAPELDRALLKWYRSLEGVCNHPISMPNILLREKSHEIATAIGCGYLPTTNWILRWKYRHNILCKLGRIETREELDVIDRKVDFAEVISAVDGQKVYLNSLAHLIKEEKPDEIFVCEHCGVIVYSKRSKKRTVHLKDCPLHAHRRDLTLGEKVRVVRALEKPGAKMVHLAKKFNISTSAISRIHKDRIDILARYNEGYINMNRKRSRVSKEPEVEKYLCDWYRMQQELGIHISSYMVREKAKEIATDMGKDFSPSDSWVFRWRHRNNVNGPVEYEDIEEDEEDENVEVNFGPGEEVKPSLENSVEREGNSIGDNEEEEGADGDDGKLRKKRKANDGAGREPKKRRFIFPRSVMCEKCGCVSVRLKNNRIRNMRHSKGCPLLKPRNEMTYQDRIKMLHELEEPGATLSSVARKYGVSTSSMSRMNQNKDTIMNQGQERGGQKRIRDCKEPEVAKQLYAWYLEKQGEGIHVTGTKLKEKAAKMAEEEGRDFKVSTGWLGRWKNRYNIFFKHQNQNGREKVKREMPKKKTSKKSERRETEMEEAPLSSDYVSHNDMSDFHVNEVAQTIQSPGMFFAQRYHQNPWDLAQQSSTSCARPKGFITTVSHSIPPEENHGPYAYDHIPPSSRHMFHHTFESFALSNGYSVGMGVGAEPSMSTRDFLQAEEDDVHHQQGVGIPSSSSAIAAASSPSISSHHSISILQYPNAHLSQSHPTPSLLNHHHRPHPSQHHLPLHQQHPPPITNIQQQQQQQQQHSSSPSMVVPEEEQDSQVMEAFKIMSSFAQKKSLGADVQAALRTIEMTMKGAGGSGPRKGVKRNTYTTI